MKVIFKNGREGLSVGPSLLKFSLAHHECDPLINLTMLTLPHGSKIYQLYYGSDHLYQLNLDGQVISDMERDDLHREVYCMQGMVSSCFG